MKRENNIYKNGDNLILKTNSNKSAKSSPAIKCMPKSDKIILCNYYIFFFIQCSNILILISQPNSEDMMILNNLHDYDGTQF